MHRSEQLTDRATIERRWIRNGESWTLRYSVAEIWLLAARGGVELNMPAPPPPPPPPPPPTWQWAICA
ncbi:MAG: hypothetical protein HC822_00295 [Oscillochloris sp.]|nr:hypothetical protein [Oscillochloris sp.]